MKSPNRKSSSVFRFAPLVLGVCLPNVVFAQAERIRFSRISLEHGLSQAAVNAIAQDRRGFMWFGTEDGLNRFDGYTFTVFKHDDLNSSSLSHKFVVAVLEDRAGVLWVGTRGGLDRFDPIRESFEHFRNDPSSSRSLSQDDVTAIHEDRRGDLWIGTDGGGLNRFDRASRTFERLKHDPENPASLSGDRILTIFEDRESVLWIGTRGGGLDKFDPTEKSFVHFRHADRNPGSLSDDQVSALYEDADGNLWVGTLEGGLNRLDRRTGRFERYLHDPADPSSLSSNRVWAIHQDARGALWVGTHLGGLNRWQPKTKSFLHFRNDPADPESLGDNLVRTLYEDRGGVLWVGTVVGLSRWNTRTETFGAFKAGARGVSLSNNNVMAFQAGGEDVVWIGTFGGGLNRFDRKRGTFTTYTNRPSDPGSLSDDRVFSLLVDRQGTLWVGTLGGLNRFNGQTFKRYQQDPTNPASLSQNSVSSLHEDREGNLWVGTFGGGLDRFDPVRDGFVHNRHDPAHPSSLSDDRVIAIYQDRTGTLWIGTDGGGVNRFDPRRGTFSAYRRDPQDAVGLSSDTVFTIREDGSGTLWIGTDAGLNGWRKADRDAGRGRFERYKERQGLPNDVIYGILPDDGGNLWLSTNKGISRFTPGSKSFRNYTIAHGLQSNEFNCGAYYRTARGEMLFGGVNGFNVFTPGHVRDNAHVPPIVLTGFWKFGERVLLPKPIWEMESLELGYRDDAVSFEFAALDYTAPEQNRYAYKLEGFDNDWTDLGTLRRATYTNLDPGDYVLKVRGSNNDGVWNPDGVALKVRVLPPPWKTWWAYGLYGVFLVGTVLTYTRAQARKLEREAEYSRKLEREVQERTRELEARSLELRNRNDELEVANNKLEQATLTDSMTGLRNRRYLMTHIKADLALVERQYGSDRALGVNPDFLFLMIDLDGFKGVNDVYGHAAGDLVLLQMRDLLERASRKSDTIIRWGGDEFMVVGRGVDRRCAETVAGRIRTAIERHRFDLGVREVTLGCSIGFALYPFLASAPTAISGEEAMKIADRALYVAKASGRNAWVGLYGTERTAPEGFMELIEDQLESLVDSRTVELVSSIHEPGRLVLESVARSKSAVPAFDGRP